MKAKRVTGRTERTEPMRMHKNLVIHVLRQHPEDIAELCPEWTGTAAEYIAELERRPGQYFVGGVLEEPVLHGRAPGAAVEESA